MTEAANSTESLRRRGQEGLRNVRGLVDRVEEERPNRPRSILRGLWLSAILIAAILAAATAWYLATSRARPTTAQQVCKDPVAVSTMSAEAAKACAALHK